MNESTLYRRNFLLHLQERTGNDQPVLLKETAHEPPASLHIEQLHNEFVITSQLEDIAGVRPVYGKEGTESKPVLLLEYIPGDSLAELIHTASIDMMEKLRHAANVAMVLSRIHEQHVMHKDLSSSNILVASNDKPGSQGRVYIIDFGLASKMHQESPSHLAADDTLVGTLAYISPEQTGRMNRQVDYRTDLYSLGVTLYELFTGQLPFGSMDALEMVHAHIASKPQPPDQIDTGVPSPVSDIILKLMAKNAEDRYQTANGLQIDLQHCLDQYQTTGRIEPFELGANDFTGRLQIPQKLYGRQAEIEQLKTILDLAVTGSAQLLLVAGYSGVGKTALVHEIQKDVISKQGIFVEGKFDQQRLISPYSALGQAFTQLVNNWLTESETSLTRWRDIVLEAVGDQGQILIDIIPALELIIGTQPEVPELGGIENQNRFNYYFNRFISNLATADHPLVVFLDDLQWIDPASLNLIESLLTGLSTSSFLIIGAYRNNEVAPGHPLMASQERMRGENTQVTTITLEDLAPDDTNHLLADTLQLSTADCHELNQALVDKTAGNPFYFRQQLYALESEELLYFDHEKSRWVWEEDLMQSLQAAGNVVDLMVRKIQTLPVETQYALSMAACIGSRFQLSTLETITGPEQTDVPTALNSALQEGLIYRTNGTYSFVHDRIQEAGYSQIPEADQPKTHLEIGRQLLRDMSEQEKEVNIFEVADHLNIAETLITDPTEREAIAKLNLQAGQKAKASTAYSASLDYFKRGIDCLTDECWRDQYALTLALYEGASEAASSDGQFQACEQFVAEVEQRAESIMDKVNAYGSLLHALVYQGTCHDAIEMVLPVLDALGSSLPAKPTEQDVEQLFVRLQSILADINVESLAELPDMTDPRTLSAIRLLQFLWSSSYLTEANLAAMIAMEMTILSIKYGNAPESAFGYACFGAYLHGEKDDIDQAYEFGLLADRHLDRPDAMQYQARTRVLVWTFILYCKQHLKNSIGPLSETFQIGVETGDIEFAAWSADNTAFTKFFVGKELSALKVEMEGSIEPVFKINQSLAALRLQLYTQVVSNLLDDSENPNCLVGEYFNEDKTLPDLLSKNLGLVLCEVYIYKIMLSYLFGEYRAGADCVESAEQYVPNLKATPNLPVYTLYASLTTLMVYAESSAEQRQTILRKVDTYQSQMKIWASHAPMNYLNKWHLVEAERLRVQGHDVDAVLKHYDRAIELAHENGYINEEALANELYARFWAERNNERFAGPLMREAHSLYLKWGAVAKAEHLTKRYPNWLIGHSIVSDIHTSPSSTGQTMVDVDLRAVLKASQEIASEIALDNLLHKLIEVVIKNAGAQKGFLLLDKEGEWIIEAEGAIDSNQIKVMQSQKVDLNDDISIGIVNYVTHTQKDVVLNNAAEEGEFKDDPTILKHKSKSILCVPLLYQGQVGAILYLQNQLSTGAFTAQRVELFKMLSSQIMVTLTNAQLYYNLEKNEEKFRGVYESMVDVFTRSTMDGICLMVSPSIYDLAGYTPEEVIGRNLDYLYAHPEERKEIVEKLLELKRVENFEFEAVRKDGQTMTVSANVRVVYSDEGEPIYVEGTTRDITEHKRADERLEVYRGRLRALASDLILAGEKERQRIAVELHDGAAQSLALVRLQLAEAAEAVAGSSSVFMLDKASQEVRRSLEQIRSVLLDLSSSTLQQMGLSAGLSDWLEVNVRDKHGLRTVFRDECGDVLLAEEMRFLLFRNVCELLTNVVKHGEAQWVSVSMARVGQTLQIVVEDDGIGFVPASVENLPTASGGFGLFSVAERMADLGGNLEIVSTPGKGCKATLVAPLEPAEERDSS